MEHLRREPSWRDPRLRNEGATSNPRIVLGIDFGTTYSGLAWMQQSSDQRTTAVPEVQVLLNWPVKNAQKVPSVHSYEDTSNGEYRQWGYSIQPDSDVMKWTKLELPARTTGRELVVLEELAKGLDYVNELRSRATSARNQKIPQHLGKSEEDVVRDYLSHLADQWYEMMQVGAQTLNVVPLDIVITHPASWSSVALHKTFRAVRGAFNSAKFKTVRDVSFISEPEACALYTVHSLVAERRENVLIKGECFVLCDAGGGTVDLVSYRIDEIKPLKLTKIGGVSGKKCGATFIDQAFLNWLKTRVHIPALQPEHNIGSGGHFISTEMGRVMLTHFERYKHGFTGSESEDLPIPRNAISLTGEDLSSGTLPITVDDLKGMFAESVDGTLDLIAEQIAQIRNRLDTDLTLKVTNIFLAGGFAENEYLFDEVRKFAMRKGVKVQRALDCWTGVVKGAVLAGMGIGTAIPTKVQTFAKHYGIATRRNGTVTWLTQKGDILDRNPTVIKTHTYVEFPETDLQAQLRAQLWFVTSSHRKPPQRISESDIDSDELEIKNLDFETGAISNERIEYNIKGPKLRKRYCRAKVDVKLTIRENSVAVKVSCDDVALSEHTEDV